MSSVDAPASALPRPDAARQWCVIHCRPRCEKKVAEFCTSKRYDHYLPLVAKTHRYGGRVRSFQHPVFTGYAFALLDAAGRATLRQHQRVAQVLEVVDQATLVHQLDQIKAALDQDRAFELLPHLAAGMRVVVQAGPLKGVEGLVARFKNKTRIVLNIDFIQQALAVEVEADWLLPV